MTIFIALFSGLLSAVGDLSDLPDGGWWITLGFPFLYMGFCLSAGLIGVLWSRTGHAAFFMLLTLLAAIAAFLLWFLDPALRRAERAQQQQNLQAQLS